MPCCHVASLRRWGPRAGRPTKRSAGLPVAPTTPQLLGVGLVWAWPGLNTEVELVYLALVLGLHLVDLSLNRYADIFYDFLLGQSVLATCILAQKHNLHILKGKVWFRDFIQKHNLLEIFKNTASITTPVSHRRVGG